MATKYIYDIGRDWYSSLCQSVSDPVSRPVPLALAVSTGTLAAWFTWRKWSNRNRQLPPSPRGWPIIGNMLDLSDNNSHKDLLRLQKRDNLPDIFTIKIGPNKTIVLNSHSAIKDAFVTQGNLFAERPPNIIFDTAKLHDEIFMKSYLDPTWSEGKQFVMSALRSAGFGSGKSAEDKIMRQVESLIESTEPSVRNKQPIDIDGLVMKTTSSVIFCILFNKVYSLDDPELESRIEKVREWFSSMKDGFFLETFPRWIAELFFSKIIGRWCTSANNCKAFVRQEIEEHVATVDPEHPRDFIDIYLTKKEKPIDIEQLVNTAFMFLPDAIESAGNMISWVFIYMTHHPDVMHKVQKEIDAVTAGNRNVTWSDKASLPYTHATMMEVVRMACPVASTALHTAIHDCTYRGYHIPAGVPIVGNLYAAMMDATNFKEPDLFKPERFLDANGRLVKTDAWIPFGMGRRKCIGELTTSMELFLIVTNLFQRYDFAFPEDDPNPSLEADDIALFLSPRPYKVVLSPRK